jgi:hypothetical protein
VSSGAPQKVRSTGVHVRRTRSRTANREPVAVCAESFCPTINPARVTQQAAESRIARHTPQRLSLMFQDTNVPSPSRSRLPPYQCSPRAPTALQSSAQPKIRPPPSSFRASTTVKAPGLARTGSQSSSTPPERRNSCPASVASVRTADAEKEVSPAPSDPAVAAPKKPRPRPRYNSVLIYYTDAQVGNRDRRILEQ